MSDPNDTPSTGKSAKRLGRHAARLAAVQAIYQLHYNVESGNSNTDLEYIANDSRDSISGNYIKASVNLDAGQFTMSIPAKNAQFSYPILSAVVNGQFTRRFMRTVREVGTSRSTAG